MIFSLLLSMQVAAAPLPQPFSETHMRDIRCVATLGLIAHEQRNGAANSLGFPNVMQRGRAYAGIVGQRVVDETGQPKEVVAVAIKQAVEDQQRQAIDAAEAGKDADAAALFASLMAKCLPLLDAEVPVEAPTQDDYLFCAAIIGIAADEVEGREGADSVNAKAMRGLARQLSDKYFEASYASGATGLGQAAGKAAARVGAAVEVGEAKKKQLELAKSRGGVEALSEVAGEEKYQRCIFLGE